MIQRGFILKLMISNDNDLLNSALLCEGHEDVCAANRRKKKDDARRQSRQRAALMSTEMLEFTSLTNLLEKKYMLLVQKLSITFMRCLTALDCSELSSLRNNLTWPA